MKEKVVKCDTVKQNISRIITFIDYPLITSITVTDSIEFLNRFMFQ